MTSFSWILAIFLAIVHFFAVMVLAFIVAVKGIIQMVGVFNVMANGQKAIANPTTFDEIALIILVQPVEILLRVTGSSGHLALFALNSLLWGIGLAWLIGRLRKSLRKETRPAEVLPLDD